MEACTIQTVLTSKDGRSPGLSVFASKSHVLADDHNYTHRSLFTYAHGNDFERGGAGEDGRGCNAAISAGTADRYVGPKAVVVIVSRTVRMVNGGRHTKLTV